MNARQSRSGRCKVPEGEKVEDGSWQGAGVAAERWTLSTLAIRWIGHARASSGVKAPKWGIWGQDGGNEPVDKGSGAWWYSGLVGKVVGKIGEVWEVDAARCVRRKTDGLRHGKKGNRPTHRTRPVPARRTRVDTPRNSNFAPCTALRLVLRSCALRA